MTCVPDRWSRVQLSDKHQAESLAHFTWQAGDLVLTDAGYKVVTSLESTQARGSQFLQRTTASHLAVQDEAGKSISLKDRVQRQGADSLREFKAWVQVKTGARAAVRVLCSRLPEEQARESTRAQRGQAKAGSMGASTTRNWCGGPVG